VRDVPAIIVWCIAITLSVMAEPFIVGLASRLVFDETATVRDGFSVGARAFWRVIGVRILQAMALGATSLFVVAPAWVAAILLFAPEAALLERASPFTACGRSQRLAGRSTGEAIIAALLLMAARVAAAPLGDYVLRTTMTQLFDSSAPPSIWDEGVTVFSLIGFFLAVPIVALVRFFLYLNVRTRAEGWDVQTRFMAIAQRYGAS
jgi:hypothetical protein